MRCLPTLTEQNAFVKRLPDGVTYRFHHMMKDCAEQRVCTRWSRSKQSSLPQPLRRVVRSARAISARPRPPTGSAETTTRLLRVIQARRGHPARVAQPRDGARRFWSSVPARYAEGAPADAAGADAQHVHLAADPEDAGAERAAARRDRRSTRSWPERSGATCSASATSS